MEFYHLRSFTVVAQTGNLTAAAKQLCTTPPAVSAHIKTLEEELKTPLFVRTSKGMTLTKKGKLLLVKAQNTLNAAIDMVNVAAENQHQIIGEFTLAINQSSHQLKIPDLLNNLSQNCHGINVNIEALSTGMAIALIEDNKIDGAFIYGSVPENLIGISVKKQDITTITHSNTLLNDESLITEIQKEPWITMGSYCPFDIELTAKLKHYTTANIKTTNDQTRLALAQAGQGMSFLEKEEAINAEKLGQIKTLSQLDFTMELFFVVKNNRTEDPVVKTLIQEIKALWNITN